VVCCQAETPGCTSALDVAGRQALEIQDQLKHVQTEEMDDFVPSAAQDRLIPLKDALACVADAALSAAGPATVPADIQNKIAIVLKANPPEPPENFVPSTDDHRFDEALGEYGHNLRVRVSRPTGMSAVIQVVFSVNIQCGDDHVLLLYIVADGKWVRKLRWQASRLDGISDAFGDFFLSGVVSSPTQETSVPLIVVAHGTPWCTSRFSGFAVDVLAPTSDPNTPRVLWHIVKGYSRGDFMPTLKGFADTFELRVADSSFDEQTFERRVIYRYRIDKNEHVHRIQPIAVNARGFVEEWLSAPWQESESFTDPVADRGLRLVHDQFQQLQKSETEFVNHSHGPVRGCSAPNTFQVEIRSTRETFVPGQAGESRPLPSRYFRIREIENGYMMIEARTDPDRACRGANLMPAQAR
jgi:hypothetical protein